MILPVCNGFVQLLSVDGSHRGESGVTEKLTMGEQAYALISHRIVSGAFAPGTKLKPDELRSEFNLGTSPIRDALMRLASEGLVGMHGQRGFYVPLATEDDLLDIAKIRTQLSIWAVEMSIAQGDSDWEASIVAAFHKMQALVKRVIDEPRAHFEEWEALNANFHRALESGCRSPLLIRFLQIAYARSERYRRHFVRYPDLLPKAQVEHRELMDAALARDVERSTAALRTHIQSGVDVVLAAMRRQRDGARDGQVI